MSNKPLKYDFVYEAYLVLRVQYSLTHLLQSQINSVALSPTRRISSEIVANGFCVGVSPSSDVILNPY